MGRPLKTINEIIQGKAAITPETALQLERVLGIPASFWNNRERYYRESLARHQEDQHLQEQVEWLKEVPLTDMVKRGWVARADNKIEQVRLVLQFFGVASTTQWHILYDKPIAAFRKSEVFTGDSGAIAAWLRQGEIEAQQIACAPFDTGDFRQVLNEIRGFTNASWRD
jgi:plasmid maintenance system antidote protein VapI